jgi:hypothetical protein
MLNFNEQIQQIRSEHDQQLQHSKWQLNKLAAENEILAREQLESEHLSSQNTHLKAKIT